MGNTEKNETNQRIIEAARHVFAERGYAGSRMQEIADAAGVNKGLLTYYDWSKQKLFEAVFADALEQFFGHLDAIIEADMPLINRLESLVDKYVDLLLANPSLPGFVLSEINQNPAFFQEKVQSQQKVPDLSRLLVQIQIAGQTGQIHPIDPFQLLMNVISMCVFPFAGRPMIKGMTGIDDNSFNHLMRQRKAAIMAFVQRALRPD
jgi:AcrR family transcriptional regulator